MRFLARLSGLVALIAFLAASALPAPKSRPTVVITATGRISSLGTARLSVGHNTCALATPKTASLAESFAVGENVTISCARGALRTIKLAPIVRGPSHAVVFTKTTIAPRPGPSSSTAFSSGFTWGSFTSSGVQNTVATSGGQVASSANATGPITTITAASVTIGDATCPFRGTAFSQVQVGAIAQMSCTTYTNGAGVGQITVQKQP